MSTLERDISELRHTVYGNGQPCIKTRVERIEVQIDTGVKLSSSNFLSTFKATGIGGFVSVSVGF